MTDSIEVIDRNLMAAYLLVKGTPGIAKSKLYFTERGRRVVEWMIENHYLIQKDGGCYLGYKAEEIGEHWVAVAKDADQGEDIESLITSIQDRYHRRLEYIRQRSK